MKFYHNPVLLIPGFYSEITTFYKFYQFLTKLGRSVYIPNLTPNTGQLALENLAKQLDNFIKKNFKNQQKLDIVGFSMGGIISRYYIQKLGGIKQTQRFVTISSPHYGTWTSYLCNRPACQQLQPESKFLKELNSEVYDLKKIQITSIYTPFDLIILPYTSSRLPIGNNIALPILSHSSIVDNENVIRVVANVLKKPIQNNIL